MVRARHFFLRALWVVLAAISSSALAVPQCPPAAGDAGGRYRGAPVLDYQVVNTYPHDRNAFTQGLVWDAGGLYEGTGGYGSSTLRRSELETGRVTNKVLLPPRYFGEGITVYRDRIIQLTWRSRIGFVYERTTLRRLDSFGYDTEGWGLTHDGRSLILSDGSASLYFLDPDTFHERRRVTVHDRCGAVARLNELEYIDGRVYANVWHSDRIAIIDPHSGLVEAWADLSGLLGKMWRRAPESVLNGIAYDDVSGRLFVTGKNWPRLFEIQLVGRHADSMSK